MTLSTRTCFKNAHFIITQVWSGQQVWRPLPFKRVCYSHFKRRGHAASHGAPGAISRVQQGEEGLVVELNTVCADSALPSSLTEKPSPDHVAPSSWTCSLQVRERYISVVYKPPNLWYLLVAHKD